MNELFNDDDERKEIKLVFGGKTIATIYSEKNNVVKIYIHKKEKAITEPKEIHDYLKMIKRDLCKIQEKIKVKQMKNQLKFLLLEVNMKKTKIKLL